MRRARDEDPRASATIDARALTSSARPPGSCRTTPGSGSVASATAGVAAREEETDERCVLASVRGETTPFARGWTDGWTEESGEAFARSEAAAAVDRPRASPRSIRRKSRGRAPRRDASGERRGAGAASRAHLHLPAVAEDRDRRGARGEEPDRGVPLPRLGIGEPPARGGPYARGVEPGRELRGRRAHDRSERVPTRARRSLTDAPNDFLP